MLAAVSWWRFWDKPSWGSAEIWAVVFLLLPSLVSWFLVLGGRQAQLFKRLITGKDGAWSTSKAGYLFWTYTVLFAGTAMLVHLHNLGNFDTHFKTEYLVVLGFPAFAAAAAKGLRSATDTPIQTQPPQTSVTTGIGQLVSDDDGDTAILDQSRMDIQYAAIANDEIGGLAIERHLQPPLAIPRKLARRL